MDVSVVVTVLNEEGAVEELYRRIVAAVELVERSRLGGRSSSTTGRPTTAMAAEGLGDLHERDPRVRVVSFKRNFGQHPAMRAGIARARGRIVVTMDGDLQNQPGATSPCWWRAIHAGADVASGRRVGRHRRLLPCVRSAVPRDQRAAGATDRRPHLRLRVRVQCLPSRCDRAGDAQGDRPRRSSRWRWSARPAASCSGRRSTSRTLPAIDRRARYWHDQAGSLLALHVLTGFWAQMVQWVGASWRSEVS